MHAWARLLITEAGTGESEVQHDGASPVLDVAHGGEVNIQDEEKDAAEEAGHAHRDAEVAGVRVVVEDAEQALAADVDVALVDDAAEDHHGEDLQGAHAPLCYLTGRRERTHTAVRMPSIPHPSSKDRHELTPEQQSSKLVRLSKNLFL